LVVLIGAAWFAFSSVAYFERCILSDSLVISIFTGLVCGVGLVVFRKRCLRPLALALIATAFPLLFLLREANILLAISVGPLIWMALAWERRVAKQVVVYAPVAAVFVIVGLWQQYRTGYFLITTGAQGNPVEALGVIDRISPVLDRHHPVDNAVRGETASMAPAEVALNSWAIAVRINERLAAQLDVRAPDIAQLVFRRYLSVWLEHPSEMLAYVFR